MDIACDAAKVAHRVYLVTRHGVHVIPKYAFGKPVDQLGNPLMGYLPFPVERTLYETVMRLSAPADPRTAGCPSPTTACCTPTPPSPPSSTTGWGTGTSP